MTTFLFGEHWSGYPLVRGTFCLNFFQAQKRLGKPWEKPWGKLRGISCEKFRRFGCITIGVKSPKNVREIFAAFFAEDFEASFAEVIARGSPNLRSTREAVCALRQLFEDTKPEWLLWSKCSSPPASTFKEHKWVERLRGGALILKFWRFLSEFTVKKGSDQT